MRCHTWRRRWWACAAGAAVVRMKRHAVRRRRWRQSGATAEMRRWTNHALIHQVRHATAAAAASTTSVEAVARGARTVSWRRRRTGSTSLGAAVFAVLGRLVGAERHRQTERVKVDLFSDVFDVLVVILEQADASV